MPTAKVDRISPSIGRIQAEARGRDGPRGRRLSEPPTTLGRTASRRRVENFSPDELLAPPRGSCRRSLEDHVHRAVFTWVRSPASSSLSGGWPSLLGLVCRSWLEGVVDVVLHDPAIPERVLDGDIMVWAHRVQEPLEVVLGWCGLVVWTSLGPLP
jgi:hypothetical protein